MRELSQKFSSLSLRKLGKISNRISLNATVLFFCVEIFAPLSGSVESTRSKTPSSPLSQIRVRSRVSKSSSRTVAKDLL